MTAGFNIGLYSKILFSYRMRRSLINFLLLFSIGFIFSGCSSLKTKNEQFSKDHLGGIVLIPEKRQFEDWDTLRLGDVFKSEELSGFIKEGLASNHDYRVLALQVEKAHQVSMIAGADQFPRFGIGARGNRAKQNFSGSGFGAILGGGDSVASSTSNRFGLSFDAAWEFDLWGKYRDQKNMASFEEDASREDYQFATLSLTAQITKAWLNIIEARKQSAFTRRTFGSYKNQLLLVERRYGVGLSSALDLRLSRSSVSNSKVIYEKSAERLIQSKRVLELLLGRYPGAALNVAEDFPVIDALVQPGLPSDLLERRPDLVAAKKRLFAGRSRVAIAKKNLLPSFSLTSQFGTSSGELKDITQSNFSIWSLAGNVFQPLFQGKRLLANKRKEEIVLNQQIEDYGKRVLIVYQEVEQRLSNEGSLLRQWDGLKAVIDETQAASQLAWENYINGLVDIMTVLDSERRLFSAQTEWIHINNLRLQNRVSVYLAVGGDLK